MSNTIDKTVEAKRFTKVWEMDGDGADVVRFVLRRAEWSQLIKGIVMATTYGPQDSRAKAWDALDVLRSAEEDIDTSALIRALTKIADYTKNLRDNDSIIVHMHASGALAAVERTESQ